jgi:threonylcarbamoyladenosine tRNA methylthiotransferase MtaB
MSSAAFTTLGCKVNQYETQKILESFEEAGFEIVPFESPADVYVVNTCSVTSQAEAKSRYTVRRAVRHNPSAKVVVTGCAAQMSINKGDAFDGADLVVPNPEKLRTLDAFARKFPSVMPIGRNRNPANVTIGRTRATLKIQDGCSVMCSYCSIPYTRPGLQSRHHLDVEREAEAMIEQGHKEIVLTGVLIGAYGPESGSGGPDFETLVEILATTAQAKGARIRISSIEMRQVTPRLIDLVKSRLVVPHLHIPLQAGDSGTLRDMNRPYTQEDYLQLCDRLYRECPGISLTTDIMVGFPTETLDRFESSVDVCRRAKYLKAHLFRFSPRFGTPADAWGDPISPEEKARRSTVLNEITSQTGAKHVETFLGRTLRVLVEGKTTKDGLLQGLTDNYIEVRFAGPATLRRQFTWVRLDESLGTTAFGELAHSALG